MLAFDLVQRIAERLEEVVVGGDDRAVQVELDHSLRLVDGGELALVIGVLQLGGGDVGGELDDFERLAVEVKDRVVRGLNPDFFAALADAFVFGGLEFAIVQVAPELLVLGAGPVGRLDKHAVMLALDLLQRIAERLEEIVVGGDDRAVEFKLDDGLGFVDGVNLAAHFKRVGIQVEFGCLCGGVAVSARARAVLFQEWSGSLHSISAIWSACFSLWPGVDDFGC